MRESTVETYLHREVVKAGGDTRKFTGRKGVPDRIVIWPRFMKGDLPVSPVIHFVETKAPGKRPRADQVREHKRLRDLGCIVLTIDTKPVVDLYVKAWK